MSAVTIGEFRPDENKEILEDVNFDPVLEVKDGDLLVSRANTSELVGASALVEDTPSNLIIPDKLWRVVRNEDVEADFHFLYTLLNTPSIRGEISRRATERAGSMKNISQEKFLDIPIQIPPYEMQKKYGGILSIIRGNTAFPVLPIAHPVNADAHRQGSSAVLG